MIGEGEYKLEETSVPKGFMKLRVNDVFFKVEYINGQQVITRYKTPMTTKEVEGRTVEVERADSDIILSDCWVPQSIIQFPMVRIINLI